MSVVLWILKLIAKVLGFGAGVAVKASVETVKTTKRVVPEVIKASKEAYGNGKTYKVEFPNLSKLAENMTKEEEQSADNIIKLPEN